MRPSPLRLLGPSSLLAMLIAADCDRGRPASAQEPAPPSQEANDRAERLEEMKQIVSSFEAATLLRGARIPAGWVREPLYRWSDPTRRNSDGTLWAWRSVGRPIAVLGIELYPNDPKYGTTWALEFTSLSTGPIEIEGGEHFNVKYGGLPPPRPDGKLRWVPAKGGLAFREVPDAPAPATTAALRIRQMRETLRRFSAREYYNVKSQDYVLRLISHPIDRYADQASGLVDGAVFAYANGTNPEVLLVMEARRKDEGPLTWLYAAAPLTRAAPTLELDKKDVWTHPSKDVPLPHETYFNARRPRIARDRD
jgi:hypothetical protein